MLTRGEPACDLTRPTPLNLSVCGVSAPRTAAVAPVASWIGRGAGFLAWRSASRITCRAAVRGTQKQVPPERSVGAFRPLERGLSDDAAEISAARRQAGSAKGLPCRKLSSKYNLLSLRQAF